MSQSTLRRPYVAVIGASNATEWELDAAEALGRLLADAGCVLVCGGLGGALVVMWNVPASPWEPSIEVVEQVLLERAPDEAEPGCDPLDLNTPRYASGAWKLAFTASLFGELQEARLPNPQTLDRDGLTAYLASMGWIADLPDVDRLTLLGEVESLLGAEEYHRLWETHVHWTRLSGRQGPGEPRPN